ncbi:MAG: DUF3047 domain-containing protein [Candidatus Omnitrophota bacterium]
MKIKIKPSILISFILIIFACLVLFVTPPFHLTGRRLPQEKLFRGVAWFKFDRKDALEGWEEKIFKGKVIYSVISDRKDSYLNAYSNRSASGIIYWLKFNPRKEPMVGWKWKVTRFPETKEPAPAGEDSWLERDDYAARFYVIFPRFPFFRSQCLEYIWAKDLPLGTVLTNPTFRNLKIIVVESGEQNLGKWVSVERNIFEDFTKHFDSKPGPAGAIALMTDSENTGSTAEAQYNDIEVGYEK